MAAIAARVLAGRVLPGGVAQDTERRPGYLRVVLTVAATHPAAAAPEGVTAQILLPEPQAAPAGTTVELVVAWTGGGMEYAGPVTVPCDTVITTFCLRR